MHFPVITRIEVEGYEMYPGEDGDFVLDQPMDATLTIVIGANGLGKSTLLLLAFRLLTGPNDISGARERRELGSAKLAVSEIPDRRTFANRVADGARDAVATVTFRLGTSEFLITRSLGNLKLQRASVPGDEEVRDESTLQQRLVDSAKLSSFADWILMLRYVSFYLDDRQVLFWDPSAQTTLLRSLFLSPDQAAEWLRRERAALTADSEHRNLRNVVNRQRSRAASKVKPSGAAADKLRAEYSRLAQEEAVSQDQFDEAIERRRQAEGERAKINIARLHAEREREAKATAYERLKLVDLASRFPEQNESALLIWSELLAEDRCLVCNHEATGMSEEISRRIDSRECGVCGSVLGEGETSDSPTPISDAQVKTAWREYVDAATALDQLELKHSEAVEQVERCDEEIDGIELAQADRQARISTIRAQLPTGDEEFTEMQNDLARFEAQLGVLSHELDHHVQLFDEYVQETILRIVDRADAVKTAFERYSHRFLLNRGGLTWRPREQRIGQSAHSVLVPSYELRLGGAEGDVKTVRSDASDVSESQKEFIDLAFRMALVEAAGESGATLLIDTPESSLDAVFSKRAAEVLAEYCSEGTDHNLVVASNLTDGRLIPEMAKEVARSGSDPVIVNLLELGRPTAALVELRDEYGEAYKRFTDDLAASK